MSQYIKTFDPKKGKLIKAGIYVNNVFIKKVNPEKHLIRKICGYAIQSSVIDKLSELNCDLIVFNEPTRIYTIKFGQFIESKVEINLGSGIQFGIPLSKLKLQEKKQLSFI